MYFFPAARSAATSEEGGERTAEADATKFQLQPERVCSELETELVKNAELTRALLHVIVNVGPEESDGLLATVCEMHSSHNKLGELARQLAVREYEARDNDITVWREKTELVALVQSLLRQKRSQAWCARVADPAVKRLLRGITEPDIDVHVGRFVAAVGAAFAEAPDDVAAAMQGVYAACGDTRAVGLFLFLRFFSPYVTHPARWASQPAKHSRLTAFAKRLGQLVALQNEHFAGSFLEPLLFQMTSEGGFYGGLLVRAQQRLPHPVSAAQLSALRDYLRANLLLVRAAASDDVPPDLWNLFNKSGKLKRSSSWCL